MSTAAVPLLPDPDGITLRTVRADDVPAVRAAFAASADMGRQGDVTDLESARQYVDWLRDADREAVAITVADALVGLVGVSVDAGNRSGWVFYWMHTTHRGRSLTSRAVATVCDRALAPEAEGGWGLERLELGHRVDNPASGAVARAAGFVVEGRERAKFLIGGERVDVLTYGRLRSDPAAGTAPLPWPGA